MSEDERNEEDIQAQAAHNRNDSPTAALPMPTASDEPDLERGSDRERRSPEIWTEWLFGSLPSGRRREEVDRDR